MYLICRTTCRRIGDNRTKCVYLGPPPLLAAKSGGKCLNVESRQSQHQGRDLVATYVTRSRPGPDQVAIHVTTLV